MARWPPVDQRPVRAARRFPCCPARRAPSFCALLVLLGLAGGGASSNHREVVRLAAFIGTKDTYDLPNAIAAQVAVERINEDHRILPRVALQLDILDTTMVRTMETRYQGISDANMAAIKLDFFSTLLGNSIHELCEHGVAGGGVSTRNPSACKNSGGIAGVLGPLYSSEAMLLGPVMERYGLLSISYGATNPTLTNRTTFPNFVRTIPSDAFQGEAIAGLVQHIQVSEVQLWSCNDVYCQGLKSVFLASIRALRADVRVETHTTDAVDLGSFEAARLKLGAVARNCSAPQVMVLMVQRSHAENLFEAARQLQIEENVLWIGPGSVTGLSVSLPNGYLGLSTSSLDRTSGEFAQLQQRWNARMAANHPSAAILTGSERELDAWPYVGFAYDAVLALAHALNHSSRGGEHAIFNISSLKEALIDEVEFNGASSKVSLSSQMEPSFAKYSIMNKRNSGKPEAIALWNNPRLEYTFRSELSQDRWVREAIVWPSAHGTSPPRQCARNCKPGSEYNEATRQCVACPAGSFEQNGKCVLCDLGEHAPLPGMITCLPCIDGYADQRGRSTCEACPENSQTEGTSQGVVSVHECLCKAPGFYRLSPGTPCIPCEEGMNCGSAHHIFVEFGFYRGRDTRCLRHQTGELQLPDNQTCGATRCQCQDTKGNDAPGISSDYEPIMAAVVHECPVRGTCNPANSFQMPQGKNQSGVWNMSYNRCSRGHTGLVCQECEEGWVMTRRGTCTDCANQIRYEDAHISTPILALVCIVGAWIWYLIAWAPLFQPEGFSWIKFFVLCLFPKWVERRNMQRNAELEAWTHRDVARETERADMAIWQQRYLSGALKILIGFCHMLMFLGTSLRADWPETLDFIFDDVGSRVSIDLDTMPAWTCLMKEMSFLVKYQMYVLGPLLALVLLTLPTLVCMCLGLFFHGGLRAHPRFSVVSNRCITYFFYIFFLIYPTQTQNVLRGLVPLACRDYGHDGKWLNADLRVNCDWEHADFFHLQLWSWCAFVLYPIGVPLLFLGAIYYTGIPDLAHKKQVAARFNALLHLRKSQVSNMANSICSNAIGYCTRHENADDGSAATRPDSEFYRRVAYLIDGDGGDGSQGLRQLFKDHYGQETHHSLVGQDRSHSSDASSGMPHLVGKHLEDDQDELSMDVADLRLAIGKLGGIQPQCIPRHDVQNLLNMYDLDDNGLGYQEFVQMLHDLVQVHCRFTGYEKLENLNRIQLESLCAHEWSMPVHGEFDADDDSESDLETDSDEESSEDGGAEQNISPVQHSALRSRSTRRVFDSGESLPSQRSPGSSSSGRRLQRDFSRDLSFMESPSHKRVREIRQRRDALAKRRNDSERRTLDRKESTFGASVSMWRREASNQKLSRFEMLQMVLDKALQLEKEGKLTRQETRWTTKWEMKSKKHALLAAQDPENHLHFLEHQQEVVALKCVTFLVLTYRVDAWYFEIVTMIYKLLVASSDLISNDKASKLGWALIINFAYLLVIFSTKPYLSNPLQNLQVASLVIICINLLFGLMLATNSCQDILGQYKTNEQNFVIMTSGGGQFQSIQYCIVVLNVSILAAVPVQLILGRNPLILHNIRKRIYGCIARFSPLAPRAASSSARAKAALAHDLHVSRIFSSASIREWNENGMRNGASSEADTSNAHPNDPTVYGIANKISQVSPALSPSPGKKSVTFDTAVPTAVDPGAQSTHSHADSSFNRVSPGATLLVGVAPTRQEASLAQGKAQDQADLSHRLETRPQQRQQPPLQWSDEVRQGAKEELWQGCAVNGGRANGTIVPYPSSPPRTQQDVQSPSSPALPSFLPGGWSHTTGESPHASEEHRWHMDVLQRRTTFEMQSAPINFACAATAQASPPVTQANYVFDQAMHAGPSPSSHVHPVSISGGHARPPRRVEPAPHVAPAAPTRPGLIASELLQAQMPWGAQSVLSWEQLGSEAPQSGDQISSVRLASALETKIESSVEEPSLLVPDLSYGSYIKVGDKYFKPAGRHTRLAPLPKVRLCGDVTDVGHDRVGDVRENTSAAQSSSACESGSEEYCSEGLSSEEPLQAGAAGSHNSTTDAASRPFGHQQLSISIPEHEPAAERDRESCPRTRGTGGRGENEAGLDADGLKRLTKKKRRKGKNKHLKNNVGGAAAASHLLQFF